MAPDTVPPHPAGISSDDPCLTHEHQLLRDQVRRFVDAEVKPHAEAWEREGRVPRAVFARMGEHGFLGVRRAEEHGGSAMDTLASAVLAEEPGRSTFGGFAATVPVHTDMASPHLDHAGCRATSCSLAAKTDPAAKGSRGISVFAVERGTPGFGVGRALDKQGWLSSDTAELVFQDCRIPHGNLLGGGNQGFYAVMRNFRNERVVLGAQAVGESAGGHRDHARLGAAAPGARRRAAGQAGHPAQARHAVGQGRGGPAPGVPRRLAR